MFRVFLLLAVLTVFNGCVEKRTALQSRYSGWEESLGRFTKTIAPDQRTDRTEVRVLVDDQHAYLHGYTTLPAVYDSVQRALTKAPDLINQFRLLPDTAVGSLTAGIVKVSVANLRSKPGHSQELATQALLGSPLEVLDFQDNWYLVRTPDRYLAWLEPGAFTAMTPTAAQAWLQGDLRRYQPAQGFLTSQAGAGAIVSDLVAGNLLHATGRAEKGYAEVSLPDGILGWVPSSELTDFHNWQAPTDFQAATLLQTAATLAGRPYLWGGTSPKGMDCSGFTKTTYYLNGYVIPRDASQQVHAGTEVPLTDDFSNLLPGDLLFFGRYRDNGSQRITHVGFYLGNGRFLHAGADNGRITENALLPTDPLYAEHRLKSLLRVKRLAHSTPQVLPIKEAFTTLLQH